MSWHSNVKKRDIHELVGVFVLGLTLLACGAIGSQTRDPELKELALLVAFAGFCSLFGVVVAAISANSNGGSAEESRRDEIAEVFARQRTRIEKESSRIEKESRRDEIAEVVARLRTRIEKARGRTHFLRGEIVVHSKLRCPFCHDSLIGTINTCSDCQAALHEECLGEAGGCVTLGCTNGAPKWAVRA